MAMPCFLFLQSRVDAGCRGCACSLFVVSAFDDCTRPFLFFSSDTQVIIITPLFFVDLEILSATLQNTSCRLGCGTG